MNKVLFFLILASSICIGFTAVASVDYSVDTLARTLPRGFYTTGVVGKSLKTWGDESSVNYGYVRLATNVRTSVLINSAGGVFEIFPISFLGFWGGADYYARSSKDLHKFDCDTYACDGSLTRKHYGAKLGLRFKNVYVLEKLGVEKLTLGKKDRVFVDEQALLLGQQGGDERIVLTSVIGHDLNDRFSVGILSQHNEMDRLGGKSEMSVFFLSLKRGTWAYTVGVGMIKSDYFPTSMTSIINIKYNGAKGLTLF